MPTCRRTSRHTLLLFPLLLASAACVAGDDVASGDAADSCAPEPATIASDTGTVIVRGSEALCTLEFREIVTLRGEAEGEGTLPRPPVAVGPGGTFLTATYEAGRIAVWSPSGEVERVFGMGEGEGPGEFDRPTNMLVDTVAGTVYIMSGTNHFDVYSIAGEYLRQINLPVPPALGAVLADGTIITTGTNDGSEPRLMIVRDDSVTRAGPPQRFFFPPGIAAAQDGVWTAEGPWYEINHHALPDGRIDLVIRREDPRFPPPANDDPGNASLTLFAPAVDAERGLAWTRLAVPDPDAPPAPSVPSEGQAPRAPMTPEERRESSRARGDGVIEVFTLDGRLIASTTYDYPDEAPWPISAGVWYDVLDDDLRSIQLLEPVLTARQ